MILVTRIFTIAMAAVVALGLIVPLALQRHNVVLATVVVVLLALYVLANVLLWKRMKRRA